MNRHQINPPDWAVSFLYWFCPKKIHEGIENDLLDQFDANVEKKGLRKARMIFVWQVLLFFKPAIVFRNKFNNKITNMSMLNNYLKVGFRNVVKQRFYSTVNIIGLSLGIAFVYMVFLFVSSEFHYDQFHENVNDIYRIYQKTANSSTGEVIRRSGVTSIPLAKDLEASIPEIERGVRFASNSTIVQHNGESLEEVVALADPGFFDTFSFLIVSGNQDSPLGQPNNIVLSDETAVKYFGDSNAIGEELKINMGDTVQLYTVSAVVHIPEHESSIVFDLLVPFDNMEKTVSDGAMTSYNYAFIETYIQVKQDADLEALKGKVGEFGLEKLNSDPDSEQILELVLQPLDDIHLNTDVPEAIARVSDPKHSYIFMGLGLLVLIIACLNFISLSTGQNMLRIKELGVRKTMGALKFQIRSQFLIEALFLSAISGLISLLLIFIGLPLFNELIGQSIALEFTMISMVGFIGLILIITLFTGSVPALFLTRLGVLEAIKNKYMTDNRGRNTRSSLLVVQFFLSTTLIIGTLIINNQLQFMQQKELGYNDERLVEISHNNPGSAESSKKMFDRFSESVQSETRVESVTATMNYSRLPWTSLKFVLDDESGVNINFNLVDKEYISAMGIEMVQGMDWQGISDLDNTRTILVNEALVKEFGWDNPLQEQIPGRGFALGHQIIGVFKDFHFSSMHSEIKPLILAVNFNSIAEGVEGLNTYVWPPMYNRTLVRLSPGDMSEGVQLLKEHWEKANLDSPFIATFVDESLNNQYATEERWSKIINYASIFAVVIACMGLIGFIRLTIQTKLKEIGVRKVLGASSINILSLLSKRTVVMLLIANLLAIPIVWWGGLTWLQSFPYHVGITVWPFMAAAGITFLLAFISITYQTVKAALVNPTSILKEE